MAEVTVLVPSYNHANFVERTLRSIFAQTLPIKKLIVIDDGSKDASVEVISRVLADAPVETEFIARENRGLAATLNQGFALADSEYFAYLGSDDIWLPHFLERQVSLLEQRPSAVLAFCHAYVIDEDDMIYDSTANWTRFADGDMLARLLQGEIFSSPGVVYRSSALGPQAWNENAKLEDYELYLRLTAIGEFARDQDVLCAWRRHAYNTSSDHRKMLSEQLAAQERVAGEIGLSDGDLERSRMSLSYNSAAEFIRNGDKMAAFELIRNNIAGAPDFGSVLKNMVRLALPASIFAAARRRRIERAKTKMGRLDLAK